MSKRLEYLVSMQAQHSPHACAIVDDAESVTYQQLDMWSNRIGNALIGQGLRSGDRVCLLIPKSIAAIAAILGVLKAGGVYVPLDVNSPAPRLARMLQACAPCWLIARPDVAQLVAQCSNELGPGLVGHLCWLGPVPEGIAQQTALWGKDFDEASPLMPQKVGEPSDLAYIFFTSGSTGDPKGVAVTHRSVIHFVSWANTYFGLGHQDRVSGHAPLHFDLSVWDVFGALSSGAELHLVPARVNLLPNLVAEFIREARLTQWFSTPSILTAMAGRNVLVNRDFPHLRRLIWCGEVFPTSSVRYWMERLPHVTFTNLYGPTETTIASSYYPLTAIPPAETSIPIGTAIPGEYLAVLDANKQPVAIDEIGELYIGGAGLSLGYWRDAEKTAKAFQEIPPGSNNRWYRTGDLASMDTAGIFHFYGRADRQIKSRGYRIELDEISVAIGGIVGVAEQAVVAIPTDGFEGRQICAAYVPLPGCQLKPADLRTALLRRLPTYMLPVRWMELDALPKNQNGKIDHRLLETWFRNQE